MGKAKNEVQPHSGDLERVIRRLEQLRGELFDAIDYAIKMDGHHKNYEGRLSLIWPHRFEKEYTITLDCYVIGLKRQNCWTGDSFGEAMDKAENDIRKWIAEEYAHDYNT